MGLLGLGVSYQAPVACNATYNITQTHEMLYRGQRFNPSGLVCLGAAEVVAVDPSSCCPPGFTQAGEVFVHFDADDIRSLQSQNCGRYDVMLAAMCFMSL